MGVVYVSSERDHKGEESMLEPGGEDLKGRE